MRQELKKLEDFILKQDLWLYLMVPLTIFLIQMTNMAEIPQDTSWQQYVFGGSLLLFYQFPVLLFVRYKAKLQSLLSTKKYIALWITALVIYPLFSILLETSFLLGDPYLKFRQYYEAETLMISVTLTIMLSFALTINSYFKTKPVFIQWIQKIGIDKALVGLMAFFSLLLGAMAASHLELFQTHTRIETDINLETLFPNFHHFIGISIQLFLHYAALYFFYYLNRYFLIAKLLKTKGLFYFITGGIASIALFTPIISQLLLWLPVNNYNPVTLLPAEISDAFAPVNAGVAFGVIAFSTPIILILEWFQQNAALSTLEKQKVQTELGLLKQQINPHFFFNTLNNLYALSIQKSMQTPEVILQLSELMRYVIYKGQEDTVALEEEMKYIEDYIQLQQIRLKKKLHLQIDKEIVDGRLQIPPLLLII